MAPRISEAQWAQFIQGLRSLAAASNRRLDLSGTQERLVVDLDGRTYLVLVPGSRQPMTPGSVAKRVAGWPRIKRRIPGGYIILSPLADLSPTLRSRGQLELTPRVAVVGLWGRKNSLASSTIDDEMGLILEAAGVSLEQIEQARVVTARQTTDVQALPGPMNADPPEVGARTLRRQTPSTPPHPLRPGLADPTVSDPIA